MVILVLVREINKKTRQEESIVSHGIDEHTFENVVLQQETIDTYLRMKWAYLNTYINEYVLT